MKYRHEIKHEISYSDMLVLRTRLKAVMKADSHCIDGKYEIRSLYFDNADDKALREKIDGVNIREKFRIRYYNGDTSFITLEKKGKLNGLCSKESVNITPEETQKIIDGDLLWMVNDERKLITELYSKMMSQGIRPKTIVDYTREPFVFSPGNVRVTLDYDIRTGLASTDIFNTETVSASVDALPVILEVKWDEFLPDIIRDAVSLESRHSAAFSKYAQCRIYG